MQPRITLITLRVQNLKTARDFYEALGFGTPVPVGEQVVFFQAGPMVFGLWEDASGHGAPGIELAHNVASPEEVDVVLAEAASAGGTVFRPASGADWGGYTGAFRDPDGYVWEVEHNPAWTLTPSGTVSLSPP